MGTEPDAIEPGRLYSFSEACRLIPSPRGGSIGISTLWRWHAQGQFTAECRPQGGRRFWFVRGAEILRLTETEPCRATPERPAPRVRSAAARRRGYEAAVRRMAAREKGVGL